MELGLFLYSKFQFTFEEAAQLSVKPAPEEKPFESKYKAREMLVVLLADPLLVQFMPTESAGSNVVIGASEENKESQPT